MTADLKLSIFWPSYCPSEAID